MSRAFQETETLQGADNSTGISRQCDKGNEVDSAASRENKSARIAAHTASQLSRTETSSQPHNLLQRLEVVESSTSPYTSEM